MKNLKNTWVLALSLVGVFSCAGTSGTYHENYSGLQDHWSHGSGHSGVTIAEPVEEAPEDPIAATLTEEPEVPKRAVLKGTRIELMEKVLFETGSDQILSESYPLLDDVVDIMETHPGIEVVEIGGHTDSKGRKRYNRRLSNKRAKAVKAYLSENGIDGSRMEAKGYGDSTPIAGNDTEEGRAENRRVEFNITQGTGEE